MSRNERGNEKRVRMEREKAQWNETRSETGENFTLILRWECMAAEFTT